MSVLRACLLTGNDPVEESLVTMLRVGDSEIEHPFAVDPRILPALCLSELLGFLQEQRLWQGCGCMNTHGLDRDAFLLASIVLTQKTLRRQSEFPDLRAKDVRETIVNRARGLANAAERFTTIRLEDLPQRSQPIVETWMRFQPVKREIREILQFDPRDHAIDVIHELTPL